MISASSDSYQFWPCIQACEVEFQSLFCNLKEFKQVLYPDCYKSSFNSWYVNTDWVFGQIVFMFQADFNAFLVYVDTKI